MDTFNVKKRVILSWEQFKKSDEKIKKGEAEIVSKALKGEEKGKSEAAVKVLDDPKRKNIKNEDKKGQYKEDDRKVLDDPESKKKIKEESTIVKKIKKEIPESKNNKVNEQDIKHIEKFTVNEQHGEKPEEILHSTINAIEQIIDKYDRVLTHKAKIALRDAKDAIYDLRT